MENFRFAVMGAGNIAGNFCDAVRQIPGCEVAAVASKSMDRARAFAEKNGIAGAYDSYEEMLLTEDLDCVYIAVLPSDHCRLSLLCIRHGIPVLCEKAMFLNREEAELVFSESRRLGVFAMEAMWSYFLPALNQVKAWLDGGRIGKATLLDLAIGFVAPRNPENRFFKKDLGGGAAYDITVYAYEIARFLLPQAPEKTSVSAVLGDTGVTVTEHVVLQYPDLLATLTTSIVTGLEERLVVCGGRGKIVLPHPHYGKEAFLYGADGELLEHFVDQKTENGFTYEIREAMDCIRGGKIESPIVPHRITTECAALFDQISDAAKGSL